MLTEFKDEQIKKLETVRDELNLKSHLFMADVKDEWNELEKKFSHFKAEMVAKTSEVGKSAGDVKAASQLLMETLEKGYQKIKSSLT